MASSDMSLEDLQRWVQALIVHPDGVKPGLSGPDAKRVATIDPADLERIILPSSTLTALERVEIYAGMYPLRMRDALGSDYPVVKQFLGGSTWNDLVAGYVERHPSKHPNLNQLGRNLPRYILTRKDLPQRTFLAEVAQLELTVTEVFDEDESPILDSAGFSELKPEDWARAVFVPVRAARVLAFEHTVNGYYQASKEEKDLPPVQKKPTYLAVYRKAYRVWRMGLARDEYRVLRLLFEGKPVLTALEKGARSTDESTLARELQGWFRKWIEEGLFSRIDLG